MFLSTGSEVEVTLRLSPSSEPVISARFFRTDTVEDEQGESFNLVALQFVGLEPQIQAQIRDTLAPKFSFKIQKGDEEGDAEDSGSWSKIGITEMDPSMTPEKAEEEVEEKKRRAKKSLAFFHQAQNFFRKAENPYPLNVIFLPMLTAEMDPRKSCVSRR